MTNPQHSPTPWSTARDYYIYDADSRYIAFAAYTITTADAPHLSPPDRRDPNARRIAAAVNFCDALTTEELESTTLIEFIQRHADALVKQLYQELVKQPQPPVSPDALDAVDWEGENFD